MGVVKDRIGDAAFTTKNVPPEGAREAFHEQISIDDADRDIVLDHRHARNIGVTVEEFCDLQVVD